MMWRVGRKGHGLERASARAVGSSELSFKKKYIVMTRAAHSPGGRSLSCYSWPSAGWYDGCLRGVSLSTALFVK